MDESGGECGRWMIEDGQTAGELGGGRLGRRWLADTASVVVAVEVQRRQADYGDEEVAADGDGASGSVCVNKIVAGRDRLAATAGSSRDDRIEFAPDPASGIGCATAAVGEPDDAEDYSLHSTLSWRTTTGTDGRTDRPGASATVFV